MIDPASVDVRKEPLDKDVKVFEIVKNGHPHRKVDVAIIAEGYTSSEEEKVRADLLFGTESLDRLDKTSNFLQPLFVNF